MNEKEIGNDKFKQLAKLMWDNKRLLQVEPSNDKKSIRIYLDNESYSPEAVFNCLFVFAAQIASKDDEGKDVAPEKAIAIFHQLRSELHSLMVTINIIAADYKIEHHKEYKDIFAMIDSFTNWSLAELDSQVKTNQIETNKNVQTTNSNIIEFNKDVIETNKSNKYLLTVSIFIAAIGLIMSVYSIATDNEKERLQNIIILREQTIMFEKSKNLEKDSKIDSLEILLLKNQVNHRTNNTISN